MLRNQKTRAWLLSLAAALLLMSNVYVGRADPEILPLLWKYEEDGLTFERICKPGKLVIMSKSKNSPNPNFPYWYLIDLVDGRIVYKSNPNKEMGIYTNYFGDRYYVVSIDGMIKKEYDVKTNQYIGIVNWFNKSSDSSFAFFDYTYHDLKFKNSNTGKVLDSFKILDSSLEPYFNTAWEFSNDSKYFAFALRSIHPPHTILFYLYDRVMREIIFEKIVGQNYGYYRYSFFNNSNKLAYADEIQLPGDDTVYSYIRIFDPDLREVIKNYKIDKSNIEIFILNQNDRNIIYQAGSNWKYIFDLIKEEKLKYTFGFYGSKPIIAVDSMIYSTHAGNEFLYASYLDWTVGINYNSINEGSILYPNPVNAIVHISNVNLQNINEIKVIDEKGCDFSEMCTVTLLPDGVDLNLQKLNTGVYFIQVSNSEFSKTYKVIKC